MAALTCLGYWASVKSEQLPVTCALDVWNHVSVELNIELGLYIITIRTAFITIVAFL